MRKILSLLSSVFDFSASIFPFVLVLYLILFLLENLFPGFVSNNFDLNIFLIPVIVFGFFAVFSNKEEESSFAKSTKGQGVTKNDFVSVAIIGIISFVILFYKTREMGISGFWISLISSIFVALMSLIIMVLPDKEKEEELSYTEIVNVKNEAIYRKSFSKLFRKKFFIAFPVGLALSVLLVFILVKNNNILKNNENKKQVQEKESPALEVKRDQIFEEKTEEVSVSSETLRKTPVVVMNNGATSASLSAVITLLLKNKVTVDKVIKPDGNLYNNATIKFASKDFSVVNYVVELLGEMYPNIERVPALTQSSGIILVIGKK